MGTAPALGQETAAVPAPPSPEAIDTQELVRLLREQDQQIQELEAECRGLAERLVAFQAEILRWVELDR
jgi:transposase